MIKIPVYVLCKQSMCGGYDYEIRTTDGTPVDFTSPRPFATAADAHSAGEARIESFNAQYKRRMKMVPTPLDHWNPQKPSLCSN